MNALIRNVLRNSSESPIRAMLALASEPGMISLAGGHPDPNLLPRDWLAETARGEIDRMTCKDLQYGSTEGLPSLRESVCTVLAPRRIHVQPDDIAITTGSQQGMSLVAQAILEPGDAIAMAPFNYPAAIQAVRYAGGHVLTLRSEGDGLGELASAARRPLKAVYVVPSYSNPTAHVMPIEARQRLLEDAARHGILVLEDDPYGELWFDRPPPDSLYALNQTRKIGATVVYLTSFSKTVLPALRLGALVAPPPIRRAVILAKQAGDVHSGLLEQRFLDAMLRSGRLPDHLNSIRAAYRAKAQAMTEALTECAQQLLGFTAPGGGMFIWATLQGPVRVASEMNWSAFGRAYRVLVVPGHAFSADGSGTEYLRLSFANPAVANIREGVRRLASGLAAESRGARAAARA
jgi:DNA-binding transcriptional MocR family regulator